jgi:hypothetical protein
MYQLNEQIYEVIYDLVSSLEEQAPKKTNILFIEKELKLMSAIINRSELHSKCSIGKVAIVTAKRGETTKIRLK